MRKPKRDETEKTLEDCRTAGRICLMLVGAFVIWGLVYMPYRPGAPLPLPGHLSWMEAQRDMRRFILPPADANGSAAAPPPPLLPPPGRACEGGVLVAVVVCSAVPNFEARRAIRDTWARDALGLSSVRVFFLLGKSSNETLNSAVYNESQQFSDIIQEDFLDTYNNLTLKSVMLLKWASQHCGNAQYIMKTDDDMFVHLPNLFRLLKAKGRKWLLLGCLIRGAVPVKDWNSKWFVPEVVYPGRVYPPYLSGTGYVMSRDAASLLYRTALNTAFFYLEDIFITGICASRAGLKAVNNEGFKFYKRKNNTCVFKTLITAHKMKPHELLQMWKNLHNPSIKCKS